MSGRGNQFMLLNVNVSCVYERLLCLTLGYNSSALLIFSPSRPMVKVPLWSIISFVGLHILAGLLGNHALFECLNLPRCLSFV